MNDFATYQLKLPTIEEILDRPLIRFFEYGRTQLSIGRKSDGTFCVFQNVFTLGTFPLNEEGLIAAQKVAQKVWIQLVNELALARDENDFRSWEKTVHGGEDKC